MVEHCCQLVRRWFLQVACRSGCLLIIVARCFLHDVILCVARYRKLAIVLCEARLCLPSVDRCSSLSAVCLQSVLICPLLLVDCWLHVVACALASGLAGGLPVAQWGGCYVGLEEAYPDSQPLQCQWRQ